MITLKKFVQAGLAGALATAGVAAGPAAAAQGPADGSRARQDCFYSSQWRGWRAPSKNVLYLGVNNRDVYKVELSVGSSRLKWGDSHLISIVRGSNLICGPLDLDLKVSDSSGFATGLIAKSIVKLTPAQVAEIPKKYRP